MRPVVLPSRPKLTWPVLTRRALTQPAWTRAALAAALAVSCALAAGTAARAATPLQGASGAAADPTPAALADLGLALLRQGGGGAANSVVSPLATAVALGMVHAGSNGAADSEIEALFAPPGPRPPGLAPLKQRLPALLRQLGGTVTSSTTPSATPSATPFVMAGRVWIDQRVASSVPAGYTQRMAARYGADAARVAFKAQDGEAARGQINAWTAQHTAGRITDLLPAGSVSAATQVTLTSAIHFKSAWAQPFDAALTEPRAFAGAAQPVPTMTGERTVLQARVGNAQVYALPFSHAPAQAAAYVLLLAVPTPGSSVDALLQDSSGASIAAWRAALQPQRCQFAMPKFELAPQTAALKPVLELLGVKTVFTAAADLRPMLGRAARGVHLGDVFQAAGITIDERGGEAVAAAAATVQAKSLALPAPACAVDGPFLFAVVHQPSGTPLFMGRVGNPDTKK